MKTLRNYLIPGSVLLIWSLWLYALIQYGSGNPSYFGSADTAGFSRSGAFGDSFGAVASLMAALAAAGAFLAFLHQRDSAERQVFESNFFVLLKHLQDLVAATDVDSIRRRRRKNAKGATTESVELVRKFQGQDAFRRMVDNLRGSIQPSDFQDIKKVSERYRIFFEKWGDDLGHYFRLLYHLIRMVHERSPDDPTYYMRIVRAHLSNSQLVLLAYNATCGEGRDIFVDYLVKYSFFHNLQRFADKPLEEAELAFFRRKIPEPAFRFASSDPITYDDRIPKRLPRGRYR